MTAESANELPEGYAGRALELLTQSRAKKGSRVQVTTKEGAEFTGLVIPRYESGSSEFLVLKLKSGYNVGIDVSKIQSMKVIEVPIIETPAESAHVEARPVTLSSQKKILLLSTGGTIASKVDYRTGAVKPAYSAAELYAAVPELGKIAEIRPEVIFSSFSENLGPEHWQKLSEAIIERSNKASTLDGVVIMLGTDTMAYVAAALSFALQGFRLPVVCVGSQRSSDRPSTDSALNIQGAARFAAYSKAQGVFVAMHKNESDHTIAIHSGVRVRKNHTSRRDAFQSIDAPLFAEVSEENISLNPDFPKIIDGTKASPDFSLKTKFDPRIALIKFHPGFEPSTLDYLVSEKGVLGIVMEGTGLGHVSKQTVNRAEQLVSKGIFVGMTSQCIWGHVDLHVYETGIDLLRAGVVPLGNMLAETALAKLSWALGNFPGRKLGELMTTNLAGEMTERLVL